ncbi:ParB N-terminal domain-containing protein [Roseomonas stagni]|uniref:ParB N-terminal domain-containing protein n=1 Tax=Falsiroseomonas algicola TaxID=2716930 RepID=A0A6M1LHU8_9PROT|nr:ParB N-terminal domain-containing protein [Falsiroseomonas algicola]NGM19928.1 ParB N-terminal domain-containing protein [Falsiroseomonas algicola]
MKVAIADLVRDPAYRARQGSSEDILRQYANAIRSGVAMPPVLVARVEGAAVLVDGHYRVDAHRRLGIPCIDANFVEATREEVLWLAAEANLRHGERLKPREVRTAFRAFIAARRHLKSRKRRDEAHALLSYREIAQALGGSVAHTTVRKWMVVDFPDIARRMGGEEGPAGNEPPAPPSPEKLAEAEAIEKLQQARAIARGVRDPERRGVIVAAADKVRNAMAQDGPFELPSQEF